MATHGAGKVAGVVGKVFFFLVRELVRLFSIGSCLIELDEGWKIFLQRHTHLQTLPNISGTNRTEPSYVWGSHR